ncbi:agouti signaling protein 1 [Narcine bancroftii]|uniref:agouti signaling protein 1 n=1 Tax=Narcine bancroftii TaxID=1343680 RepID=UPI00383111B3
MARTMYCYWILQCTCYFLVYSHFVIEETPQKKNSSDLPQATYISIVELPSNRKISFIRENGRKDASQHKRINGITMTHKMKRLRAYNGHCVQLWGMCLPPSPPCCNPCAFCHCRFFNTVCYCRKLNPKCVD